MSPVEPDSSLVVSLSHAPLHHDLPPGPVAETSPPDHIDTTDSYVAAIYRERKIERDRRRRERERDEAEGNSEDRGGEEPPAAEGGVMAERGESVGSIGDLDSGSLGSLGLVRVPSIEATTQSIFTGAAR